MSNKSFRIRYEQDNPVDHLKIKIEQDFDFMEILSLKITQEDVYKLYTSDYGVVVGRVLANDGFGIPNAKISIFIKNQDVNNTDDKSIIYPYKTPSSINSSNIRYNLLPATKVNKCHQNVGSLPSKRDLLDNSVFIEVFDEFYKYTTVTNESGDYMLFGIPTGNQQIHVDIDLSDIGILSQSPRDMEYKGYGIKQFDSPNKFKKSTNLGVLPQIISEDTSVFVYPFWGDVDQGEIAISKKNVNVQYKFEPTCVFMGSIFTDSSKGSISKTCRPAKASGKMSEMTTSQGKIEMLRYDLHEKIERFDINGGTLINGDGVWCYQVPMNLDYVITDEFGNLIPSTQLGKGIPTRTKARFRLTLNDNGDEFTQNKTGVYLVPNNPKSQIEEDYSFDNNCNPESFTDLMWNKVYSVKNYIPRIQKFTTPTDRHFNGIKSINYHEGNNPVPYNNIWININLRFMLICLLTLFLVDVVAYINDVIDILEGMIRTIVVAVPLVDDETTKDVKFVVLSTQIGGECTTLIDHDYFIPFKNRGAGWTPLINNMNISFPKSLWCNNNSHISDIKSCIETQLSNEEQVVNFDFTNDWLNGSLYAPRFLTKTKKNKKTGAKKVTFCGSYGINKYGFMYLMQTCAPSITRNGVSESEDSNRLCNYRTTLANDSLIKQKCYVKYATKQIGDGVIKRDSSEDIYYYRGVEFAGLTTLNKYLYATDIILLGSLTDCDQDGIPQLHQLLPSTTFLLPPDSFEPDDQYENVSEDSDRIMKSMSGVDWGNKYSNQENGLFVAIDCMSSTTIIKTCVNASRMCELGVDFDEKHTGTEVSGLDLPKYIDGFISTDEISDGDARAMFSTLNGNGLKTKLDKYNQTKYDFSYSFPDGFDGKLRANLPDIIYENVSNDYYKFRFGENWDNNGESYYTNTEVNTRYSFPKYNNSFYFYFGLKPGLTAIDVFNNLYFVPCADAEEDKFVVSLTTLSNEIGCPYAKGVISVSVDKCVYPYTLYVNDIIHSSNVSSTNDILITGLTSGEYMIKVVDSRDSLVSKSRYIIYEPCFSYSNEFINGVLEVEYTPDFSYAVDFVDYVDEVIQV